jgi:hypothetical protein
MPIPFLAFIPFSEKKTHYQNFIFFSPDGSEKLRRAALDFFLTEKSDQRKLLLWLKKKLGAAQELVTHSWNSSCKMKSVLKMGIIK